MTTEAYRNLVYEKWLEQDQRCPICKRKIDIEGDSRMYELAHRIPKGYRKDYGEKIVDHPRNLVLVDRAKEHNCNDAVLLAAGSPLQREALRAEIERLLLWDDVAWEKNQIIPYRFSVQEYSQLEQPPIVFLSIVLGGRYGAQIVFRYAYALSLVSSVDLSVERGSVYTLIPRVPLCRW